MPTELVRLTVASAEAWQAWLARESTTSPGVWLTLAKNTNSPSTSLTYPQALDEALCYGWIDSTGYRVDDTTRVVRFTPRKAKSIWSQRNVGYVARLEQAGRMRAPGRAAVDAAKADGRWAAAYTCSGDGAAPPQEFLDAVRANPAAQVTWDGLNKGNRWKIYFTLTNLRTPAGRARRIEAFVEMLARGETPIPQKRKRKLDVEDGDATRDVGNEDVEVREKMAEQTSRPARRTRSGRPAPSYNGNG